jgi:hypothetical protein
MIKTILSWLLNKFWHFLTCLILSAFFTLILGWITAFFIVISLGIGKECWDKWRGNIFDVWDLGADILGTIIGVWLMVKFG